MTHGKINKITYNWFAPVGDGYLDVFDTAEVGTNSIISITEHSAAGEGDKWYYDIWFEDGSCERVFNPNRVFYSPKPI